jgi:TM2 domain-containing membrane protein YozV
MRLECRDHVGLLKKETLMSENTPPPPPPPHPGAGPERQAFVAKKIPAGVLGILLGAFGVHKFTLGLTTPGAIMLGASLAGLLLSWCFCIPGAATIVMGVIGLIEGIIYLTKSDDEFYELYAVQKKQWF